MDVKSKIVDEEGFDPESSQEWLTKFWKRTKVLKTLF